MFSKKKISFPNENSLLRAISFSQTVSILDNEYTNKNKISDKDKAIFEDLCRQVIDGKYLRVPLEALKENHTSMPVIKSTNPIIKSSLASNIKKYVRKERRRLQKQGQENLLYDLSSELRHAFIGKILKILIAKHPDKSEQEIATLIQEIIEGYRMNG